MSNDTDPKPEQKKPKNNGDSMFEQMVRRQVRRQRNPHDETYTPGSVGLYDPTTGRNY